MKKIAALFILLISINYCFSQSSHTDIIIPEKSIDTIFNCQIISVTGSLVVFSKDEKSKRIEARSIIKNNQQYFLKKLDIKNFTTPTTVNTKSLMTLEFQGHDYIYYYERAHSYRNQRNLGQIFALSLSGVALISAYPIHHFRNNHQSTTQEELQGTALMGIWLGTVVLSQLGYTLWIARNIQYKNELKALSHCRKKPVSLGFGMSKNGFGLKIRI